LDCGLADALKQSQDCIDPSGRQIDFGHLIIGLDARYDPQATTRIFYPYTVLGITKTVDMGGNGTELVTWLGDLGGGAAMLSVLRAATASTSVKDVFSGHPPTWTTSDYGGSINLEGDIAGFMTDPFIGPPLPSASLPPSPGGKNLCDALQDYLSPPSGGTAWNSRATTFLTTYGANFDPAGNLTNRGALISSFAAKIQIFACNYLASRVKDKKIPFLTAKTAADHVIPSSEEVAEAFVDALDDSRKSGGQIEAKKFPSPKPARPGACALQIAAGGLISIF
jgi:hypothetical protein